jgi:hypothetical protein
MRSQISQINLGIIIGVLVVISGCQSIGLPAGEAGSPVDPLARSPVNQPRQGGANWTTGILAKLIQQLGSDDWQARESAPYIRQFLRNEVQKGSPACAGRFIAHNISCRINPTATIYMQNQLNLLAYSQRLSC